MGKNWAFTGLLVVIATLLGFALGRSGPSSNMSSNPETQSDQVIEVADGDYKTKYLNLKSKFSKINSVDMEEYVRLRSQADKFNKANDILGQMLVIFLAELGLKLSDKTKEYSEGLIANPEQYQFQEKQCKKYVDKARKEIEENYAAKGSPEDKVVNDWRKKVGPIKRVKSEEEAKRILDDLKVDNFFSELKTMEPLIPQQLAKLQGWFEGTIVFDDIAEPQWLVEMSLEGELVEGKVKGKRSVKLTKENKVFSNSNENGDISTVKSVKGQRGSMIVGAGKDLGYFHLFYAKGMKQLVGNYYKQTGVGEFEKAGKVFLEKR